MKKERITIAGIILTGIILIGIILIWGYVLNRRHKAELASKSNTIAWLQDTVKTYRDKHGRWVAEKKVLVGSVEDIKSAARITNDKLLLEIVKTKNIKSGTIIHTETKLDTITKVKIDTALCAFDDSLKNDYIYLKESLRGDSIRRTILFKDTISFVTIETKKDLTVKVKNESPYAMTKEVKSFTVAKPKEPIGGRIIAFIAGGFLVYLITK